MTQHIQKMILGLIASAFIVVAFSVESQAQTELNNVWDRTTVTSNLPSWFSAGFVRGMAHGTVDGNERLYAADRTNTTIRVMDPETGADITPATAFDLSGVSGGTYPMNTIEVSDDGVIFLGNLTVDAAASPFRLYWWDSEGGAYTDSLTFSATGRVGDRFTVVGSLSDNTIEIWMPAAGSDPGVIYVATTADQGATWDIETITVSGDVTAIGSGVTAKPFAPGRTSDFYVAGNAITPTRYDASGAYVADSQISSTSRNGFDLFTIGGVDHLSVYTYRPDGVASGNKTGQVYVYDVTDPTSPTIVGESPLMGPDADSFSSIYGEARVRVNNDDTYTVFALEGVNGLASFTNAEPPYVDAPSNLFFSEYIEGSSNNKALEITNNTDSTVQLVNYQIEQSVNGGGWQYYHSFAEGASIEPGGQYVLITDQVSTDLYAHENADEVLGFPSPIHFNGDDARALIHIDPITNDTTRLDIFGDPDSDPGSGWDVAGVTTATGEHTLLRKASVTEGNTTVLGSFGTNAEDSEWIVLNQNDFHNLGSPTKPLSGDYFIPQGTNSQGFISMNNAVSAVNALGLEGATTLYINTSDTLHETEAIKLERDDLSETNSLTVKPAPGTTPTLSVIGGSGGDGFWIETTDWVTIDGSNTVDGSTKDLTITSADTTFSAVVYVTNSSNVTVKNTIVTYTGGDTGIYGVIGDVSGTGVLSNFLVENNTVGTTAGEFRNTVTLWGSSDNPAQGSVINNIIYTSQRGITTFYNVDNTFTGNNITIANPEEDRGYFAGIYLAAMSGETNVIGNEISGLAVNQTTAAAYAAGILINGNLGTVNVVNNMVSASDFHNVGAAVGNEVFGIMLNNPAGEAEVNVYHNTVHIGSSSETGIHAAFGTEEVATAQIWDFQNNIFSVEQDDENAYAFHWPFTSADNLSSNYNNLYVSGSSASIGYFNDATTATLADWQTASGEDANSTSVSVEFVSETDLRLAAGSIGDHDLAGTPLASVTTDIDGTDRSETHPYKGAFEGGTPVPIENVDTKPNTFSLSQNYPNPFNPTSNIQFALPQQSNVKLEVFNINGQLVRTLVNSRMSAGEHTIQFDARDLASGIYIYRIIAGDFVQTKKMTLIK